MFLKTSGGAIAQFPPPLGCEPDHTSHLQWNIGQWQFFHFGHSQWRSQNEAEEAMVPPKKTC